MSNHTCIHCGCILEPEEVFEFQNEVYCRDCLDELTVTCNHCGQRIYQDNDEGDSNISLCSRCYADHFVACERCGLSVDNFASLSNKQIKHYSNLFRHPEVFLQSESQLLILQMET